MITLDLVEYIKSQLNKNISKDSIILELSQVGWRIEDIEEGFSSIESSVEENVPTLNTISENLVNDLSSDKIEEKKEESNQEVHPVFDKYRELPEELEAQYIKNKAQEEKKDPASSLELLKIWVPTT
ncbi:MAG: hypothetical protein WCI91_04130, partial [Candidatus Nomurabacteria bacterium]